MLTKYGAVQAVVELARYNDGRKEFPYFIRQNQIANQRLASIEPVLLDPSKFLYMRTRMVSAVEMHGSNANGDAFEHEELAARHATFIRAAVNIDHDNDAPEKAVGFILDARYISEMMYVEGIHAIDKEAANERYPGLIRKIESGIVTDTSMGCYVEQSVCSHCLKEAGWDGNWDPKRPGSINKYVAMLKIGKGIASVPEEYCQHIGQFGEKKGGMNGPYEINRNVTFFEDSIITTAGADKDAKYLEKMASTRAPAPWLKYIIRRAMVNGCITAEENSNLKGDESMKNHAEVEKKAEESKLQKEDKVSRVDPKDAGSAEEKDKALHDESKGKAPEEGTGGMQTETVDDKGNYALASMKSLEAIAEVKKLAKSNPEAVKELIFAAEKEDEKDEKKEMKKEEAVKSSTIDKKTLLGRALGVLEKLTAAIQGNQLETADDKGDYGSASEKDGALASQAKGTTSKEGLKGSPLMTADDPADKPLGKSAAKKPTIAVEDEKKEEKDEKKDEKEEDKKTASIIDAMAEGKSLKEAKESVESKKTRASREAARKALSDDMNKGSMGSESSGKEAGDAKEEIKDLNEVEKAIGTVEDVIEEKEEKAVASKKTADGNPEGDMKSGTEETKETSEMRKDAADEEKNEKKDEKKEEKAEYAKADIEKMCAEARDSMTKEAYEKYKREAVTPPGKEKMVQELKKNPDVDNPWAVAWSQDSKEKDGAYASPEKAEEMVEEMDEKQAAIRALMDQKESRAQLMAKAGYRTAAASHISGISILEKHAVAFEKSAIEIEALLEDFASLNEVKQKAVKGSLKYMMAKASQQISAADEDLKKMKDEDMKKEEQYQAAKKTAELEARLKREQAEKQTAQGKVAEMVKARAVNDLIRIGAKKGIVTEATRDRYIKKLSTLSEVQFDATKTAWLELPDKTAELSGGDGYVPKHIREASMKPSSSMGELVASKDGNQDDSLDSGHFFE